MAGELARMLASLQSTALDILWCALTFATLAFLARGIASWRTAHAAAGEVSTNVTLFAIDTLFVAPALAVTLAALGAWMQRGGLTLIDPNTWTIWPAWGVVTVAIFAGDFIGYWRHRLEHTPPLWPAHAIHHSDTAMTWTTGLRFHPINRFSTALIDTGVLALLGFPPWALAANNLVRHYYGLFIHADLPWTYGLLGRVFVSPVMHRWHHVRDGRGVGANFATLFSVFDQVFRTYYAPGPCSAPLGVPASIGRGALAQLIWPFRVLTDNFKQRRASRSASY
jgi:sterol desaturase/sphingolipid hydroxylase (fatty acid hydroxylase superfamily)